MAIYLLKLNFALMILYGFYRLVMAKDTFFGYRRVALLAILMVSMLVPLFDLQSLLQHNTTAVGMATAYADYVLPVVPVYASSGAFTWMDGVAMIYWVGVGALLLRLMAQLGSILRKVMQTTVTTVDGTRIHRLEKDCCPFSFFRWIFVCPESHTAGQLREIMVHEQAHVEQYHSLDIVISELFCVFNWFNPFCYLMKHEIRLNLEYLADKAVLDRGNARKTYQYHLLGLAYHSARRDLTNNFNVLPLKKRIQMMNKNRTKEIGKAKYLFFVPLAAGLLAVSNIEMIAHNLGEEVPVLGAITRQDRQSDIANVTSRTATPKQQTTDMAEARTIPQVAALTATDALRQQKGKGGKIFEVVEEMPSFPGGPGALISYLGTNVKYPKECHEKGIQGRVIVQFVVEADGSVTDARIVRSVDPLLDAEALRVVSGMPKWTPGKQNGEVVRMRYNLPLMFKLDGVNGKTEPKTEGNNE
jgi:TonB family protein